MRRWLGLVLLGCGAGEVEAEVVPALPAALHGQAEAPAGDVETELEDVRYLLREAVRDHEAGVALDAEQRWRAAMGLWQTRLAAVALRRDRRRAVELEHAFGRLGDVLASGRGRATAAWARVDQLLGEAPAWMALPSGAEAGAPPEPPEPSPATP